MCLTWPPLMAYQRIATHPSIFRNPLDPATARWNVRKLLALPRVRVIGEDDDFSEVYARQKHAKTKTCQRQKHARHLVLGIWYSGGKGVAFLLPVFPRNPIMARLHDRPPESAMPSTLGAILIGIFGVIGLLLFGFLWFGDDGFGEPPLIAKLFGSCIAVFFMIFGFGGAFSALRRKPGPSTGSSPDPAPPTPGSYQCPRCGSVLGNADVSPKGDVKCEYCAKWFNIHEA